MQQGVFFDAETKEAFASAALQNHLEKGYRMNTQSLIFALAALVAVILAYRLGIKDGRTLAENGELSRAEKDFFIRRKTEKHKETEEERKVRIEAENVENYGTCVPQQEVA